MLNTDSIPDFNSFYERKKNLDGTFKTRKVSVKEVLDKLLVITKFAIAKSKFNSEDYAMIEATDVETEEELAICTSSKVLLEQLNIAKELDKFPFKGVIKLIGNYYTFA